MCEEDAKKCGQYKFKCIDPMTFEICEEPDSDGNTDPPMVRQCPLETRCNEDDPAYCTPIDNESDCQPKNRRNLQKHSEDMEIMGVFQDGALYKIHEENVLGFTDDEDKEMESSTIKDDDLNENCDEVYTETPVISCEMPGFYPGN